MCCVCYNRINSHDEEYIMSEKRLKSTLKYACSFLELYEDHVELSDHKTASRVVIKHVGGASVLPLTSDNKVILTTQYRYPINQLSIEIPAGKRDFIEEDGLSCAKRELEEETGYQSDHFEHYMTFFPCVGYSDEKLDIFIAKNCYRVINPRRMDEDENISIMILDKQEVKKLLHDGRITDGKTIIALQHYLVNL